MKISKFFHHKQQVDPLAEATKAARQAPAGPGPTADFGARAAGRKHLPFAEHAEGFNPTSLGAKIRNIADATKVTQAVNHVKKKVKEINSSIIKGVEKTEEKLGKRVDKGLKKLGKRVDQGLGKLEKFAGKFGNGVSRSPITPRTEPEPELDYEQLGLGSNWRERSRAMSRQPLPRQVCYSPSEHKLAMARWERDHNSFDNNNQRPEGYQYQPPPVLETSGRAAGPLRQQPQLDTREPGRAVRQASRKPEADEPDKPLWETTKYVPGVNERYTDLGQWKKANERWERANEQAGDNYEPFNEPRPAYTPWNKRFE